MGMFRGHLWGRRKAGRGWGPGSLGGGEVDPLKLCLWVKEDEGRALTTEQDVPGDLTRATALRR